MGHVFEASTSKTCYIIIFHWLYSAGVGRTGTFIGLDSLLKQGQELGRINVSEFVRQMREDRMTMVQTAVSSTHEILIYKKHSISFP